MTGKRCHYCGWQRDLVTLRGQGTFAAVSITVCRRCAERARERVQRLITPRRRKPHASQSR